MPKISFSQSPKSFISITSMKSQKCPLPVFSLANSIYSYPDSFLYYTNNCVYHAKRHPQITDPPLFLNQPLSRTTFDTYPSQPYFLLDEKRLMQRNAGQSALFDHSF